MPQQPAARKPDFSQRVITALTDLADLSLRASALRFSPLVSLLPRPDTLDQLATLLLHRLMVLCEAQQGAFFLAQHTGLVNRAPTAAAHPQESVASHPALSLLASTQMSAEEAHAALATYTLVAAPLQWSVDRPPTLVWRRSLDAPLAKIGYPDKAVSHLASPSYALLLFAWPETSPHTQKRHIREREQALQLLPFLTDAVDAILLHVLVALSEREQSKEWLPADLLATVGHEFRGPLTTIQGYATTLQRHDQQLAPEERQDFLAAISEAGTHLGKLVDRFLELVQLETSLAVAQTNTAPFVPVPVNLVVLAQEAIAATKKTRSHRLILASPPANSHLAEERTEGAILGDELSVSGDRHWLRMLLDILLENAIVYSPQGGLIEVSIEFSDPAHLLTVRKTLPRPDNHGVIILPGAFQENEVPLEIQVRDHGIGIEPVHLSRLFQRFYRVDTRLTRDVNGLGLGLALCKAIVARHRGMLWVESMMGTGSTFHILLPREAVSTIREIR